MSSELGCLEICFVMYVFGDTDNFNLIYYFLVLSTTCFNHSVSIRRKDMIICLFWVFTMLFASVKMETCLSTVSYNDILHYVDMFISSEAL